MSAKKILLLAGDFVEDYEIMVPFQALQAVGHEVHAVCPEKETDETVKTAVHDFRGDQTYMETRGHDFAVNATFADIDPADYDALVIPGGRAPEYLRNYEEVISAVQHFFETDKPVACICHGAQILAAADVIEGYGCTAYPALKYDVEAAGAEWRDGVTTDGNLVTAQAWPDHPEWLAQFLDVLGTEITHREPVIVDD
ncbi:DJ-1/PfpI family protein [Haloarchaeobius sp. DT45]|uniref:DJ-1/PfpI family protein n=1 Tax=Haloarchaeobius sp. DT45 TaxID=3446116 RepID=UPI003F6D28B1